MNEINRRIADFFNTHPDNIKTLFWGGVQGLYCFMLIELMDYYGIFS